jgi:hypothetical protein
MFGRSFDLRQLDAALRGVDIHPALVPEGVKMTIVNLMKDHGIDEMPEAYPMVADMFGYAVMGANAFEGIHGGVRLEAVEARVEKALEAGEGMDAQLLLLAVHAKLIQPEIVARYDIAADDAGQSDETG